ncbi:MAG: TonB-dependent receptor [Bacteroidia bacterium]|nr:TonB-dependent receptor [Bacteroidia bacterium]
MKNLFVLIAFVCGAQMSFAQFPSGSGGGAPGGQGGRPAYPGQPPAAAPAQVSAAPRGNGEISGVILDSVSREPVTFATLTLFVKGNPKPVDGVIADDKGTFKLSRLGTETYNLQVSSLGYKTQTINDITLEKGQKLALDGVILAPEITTLDGVDITSQRSLIEEKVDRLVYNAEKDLSSKGGDAADVLRKVPMLSVDLEGNVSLRGSQNIRVLINNKPSTIMATSVADALRQIPADMIKTVEVITSPSAKYDGEGSGGIINIITKKNTLQGLTLNLDTGVGNRSANLGLNGSYRKGKFGATVGGWGRAFYNAAESNFEQTIADNAVLRLTRQTVDAFDRGAFGHYSFGMDYDISKNQFLTFSSRYGLRAFNRTQDQLTELFQDGTAISAYTRDVDSRDNSGSIDLNLDYTRIFKPGHEWSVATQLSRNDLINNFTADLLDPVGAILSREKNLNDNFNQELTFQTDYQMPISKNQIFETGAKVISRQVISDYRYEKSVGASESYEIDPNRPADVLDYTQQVGAGYLSYTLSTAKKYSLKAGVRYEYTGIEADSRETGDIVIPSYYNLLPSVNVSKQLKEGFTLKAGYNRRIQRPGLQQLNPNVNAANPQNITIGNPSLSPELTDNLEISLGAALKKTYLSVSLFGRLTNNVITQIRVPSDSVPGAIITTFENIGKQQTFGTNLFGNIYITPKWTLNGGGDILYTFIEGQATNQQGLTETLSNQGFVLSGRIMTSVTLPKGFTIQGFGFMRGAQVQLQGRQNGFGMYSLGVRKEFANKKGSLGLAGDNFFTRGLLQRSEFTTTTFTQVNETLLLNRGVKLTFNYRFGKMSFEQPRRRSKSVNNDDIKAGDDNNGGGGGGMNTPGGGGGGGGRRPQ